MTLSNPDTEHDAFRRIVLAQLVFRVGWIFKTESIVIPTALDSLAGAGWIRGFLPLLSRLGLCVSPALLGRFIRHAPRKKTALAVCVACMALCMTLMSALWWSGDRAPWRIPAFLLLYAAFFSLHGLNQVAFGTLQGKLIRPTLRGRLMVIANLISSTLGVLLLLVLLPRWLSGPSPEFQYIFLVPAAWFAASSLINLTIAEPAEHIPDAMTSLEFISSAASLAREHPSFRRALVVAGLTGFSFVLFPHYQALAKESLGLKPQNLTSWIVVQCLGAAIASTVAGPLADRHGNRIVLRCILGGLALTPVLALSLAQLSTGGATFYPAVFLLIGLTPVMFRIFQNYTIEIVEAEHRAEALSAVTGCFALPVLVAPGVGAVIDQTGFTLTFLFVAAVVCLACLMTCWLSEPRAASKSIAP